MYFEKNYLDMNISIVKIRGFLFSCSVCSVLCASSLPAYSSVESKEKKAVQRLSKPHNYMRISSGRCVALRKGLVCYKSVVFSWSTQLYGKRCLYNQELDESIYCWEGVNQGSFTLDFHSSESVKFELRDEVSQKVLANVEIIVAWVYDNSRRNRASWRLF